MAGGVSHDFLRFYSLGFQFDYSEMPAPDNREEKIMGNKMYIEKGTDFIKKTCFNDIFLFLRQFMLWQAIREKKRRVKKKRSWNRFQYE